MVQLMLEVGNELGMIMYKSSSYWVSEIAIIIKIENRDSLVMKLLLY